MKIRTRIMATLAVVAVLPAVSLVCIAHRETATEIGRRLDRALRSAAERAATQIDGFLTARLEEVRSLATLPSMQVALADDQGLAIAEAAHQVLTILDARDPVNSMAFGLVDANGKVIVDAEPRRVGQSEAQHRYFRETLLTKLPWANHEDWTRPGDRVLVVASPVRNPIGEPIGVLRLVLENATLQQILSTATSAHDLHDIALFDQDRRLVADTWCPTRRHEVVLQPPELIDSSLQGIAHFTDWIDAEGTARTPGRAVYWPLTQPDWRLMAWQPQQSYESVLTDLGNQRLLILGGMIVLLVAAAWLSSLWIARPIQRLERAATQIAEGDLEAGIPASSGETGTLGATLQVMRDRLRNTMRELQEAATTAQNASAAKSQFLANMSHELRTPLTAILGFAELIAEGTAGDDEQQPQQHAATIHHNARHLLSLVNEVLDLAKVESGTLAIRCGSFSPAQLAQEVVDALQVQAHGKGVALRCRLGALPPTLISDQGRLRQILLNLVGNALKFTDTGMVELDVAVTGQPPVLACRITDTGPGIAADRLPALFQPFSQVDASASRRHGGIGLGLAISRQLARTLGGDILVASEPGRGSVFTLEMPAVVTDAAQRPGHDRRADKPVLQGRILVVEDGADNRRLFAQVLRKAGAEVTLAEDGAEGLRALCIDGDPDAGLLSPPPFDLVLMDMQMPVMDGMTATRKLRELGLHIPVVALTAHAMEEARTTCIEAGCDEWETKPITARRLVAACAEWLAEAGSAPAVDVAFVDSEQA